MGAPASMKNCKSSGAISSSANVQGSTVLDKSGVLCGVLVVHNGTNDATVTIYDDAATGTGGTVLFYCKLHAAVHKGAIDGEGQGGGSGKYQELFTLPDVIFKLGCYVAITTATVYVYYR